MTRRTKFAADEQQRVDEVTQNGKGAVCDRPFARLKEKETASRGEGGGGGGCGGRGGREWACGAGGGGGGGGEGGTGEEVRAPKAVRLTTPLVWCAPNFSLSRRSLLT